MAAGLIEIPLSVSRRDAQFLFADASDLVAEVLMSCRCDLVSPEIAVATKWLLSIARLESEREATVAKHQHLGSIIGRTPAISCELLGEGGEIAFARLDLRQRGSPVLSATRSWLHIQAILYFMHVSNG